MLRRLYFLFPSAATARAAVAELQQHGVRQSQMHALARAGVDLGGLPPATAHQHSRLRELLGRIFWDSELAIFFLALVGLVLAMVQQSMVGALAALAVMALSFVSGALYAIRLPDTPLAEFRGALSHGEVLLLVDVRKHKVAEIEDLIHRHHPAAVAGGSSWTLDAWGI